MQPEFDTFVVPSELNYIFEVIKLRQYLICKGFINNIAAFLFKNYPLVSILRGSYRRQTFILRIVRQQDCSFDSKTQMIYVDYYLNGREFFKSWFPEQND